MDTRDSKGRFTKGNPGGGRPKKKSTIREIVQTLSPQAVTRLGDLIHSDNETIALNASSTIAVLSLNYEMNSKKNSVDDDGKSMKSLEREIEEIREHFAKFGLCFTFDIIPFYRATPADLRPILDDTENI